MSDKTTVGRSAVKLETAPAFPSYSKVVIITGTNSAGEEVTITSGNDNGRTLEVNCPWGTQAMADNILAQIRYYVYRPYTASGVLLDPAAELGDGVEIDKIYSVIATQDITFGPLMTSNLGAPEDEEIDHEYPYEDAADRNIARRINKRTEAILSVVDDQISAVVRDVDDVSETVSSLTVSVGNIRSEVSQKTDAAQVESLIEQWADSITLSVNNGEKSSTITITGDGISTQSETIEFTGDVVFESDLSDGTTLISGDCIRTGEIDADLITTGKLDAEYIDLYGEMDVYQNARKNTRGGSFGYLQGYTVNESGNVVSSYGLGLLDDYGDYGVIATTTGAKLFSPNAAVYCTGETSSTGSVWLVADYAIYRNQTITAVSDRRLKEDINYDMASRIKAFDKLKPCTFRYKTDKLMRQHAGLIAQEVIDSYVESGVDVRKCAEIVQDDKGYYHLSYEEMVPVLIAKVQDQQKQIDDLTARIQRLEEMMTND